MRHIWKKKNAGNEYPPSLVTLKKLILTQVPQICHFRQLSACGMEQLELMEQIFYSKIVLIFSSKKLYISLYILKTFFEIALIILLLSITDFNIFVALVNFVAVPDNNSYFPVI
jgi:hypothetical protein